MGEKETKKEEKVPADSCERWETARGFAMTREQEGEGGITRGKMGRAWQG